MVTFLPPPTALSSCFSAFARVGSGRDRGHWERGPDDLYPAKRLARAPSIDRAGRATGARLVSVSPFTFSISLQAHQGAKLQGAGYGVPTVTEMAAAVLQAQGVHHYN